LATTERHLDTADLDRIPVTAVDSFNAAQKYGVTSISLLARRS
jgi:hypothetical protein